MWGPKCEKMPKPWVFQAMDKKTTQLNQKQVSVLDISFFTVYPLHNQKQVSVLDISFFIRLTVA